MQQEYMNDQKWIIEDYCSVVAQVQQKCRFT
jgi:hypothetical protein